MGVIGLGLLSAVVVDESGVDFGVESENGCQWNEDSLKRSNFKQEIKNKKKL